MTRWRTPRTRAPAARRASSPQSTVHSPQIGRPNALWTVVCGLWTYLPLEPNPPPRAPSPPTSPPPSAQATRDAPARAARSGRRGPPRSSRAVGVQQQHAQLAAVAGVDQARGVDERDPVLAREPRARQHQAGVALRDRDRDAGADAGALARRAARPPPPRRGRSRRRRRGRGSARAASRRAARSAASLVVGRAPFAPSTAKRSKRGATPAGTRARMRTPSGVSSRSMLAGEVVQLGQASRPRCVGHEQLHRPQRRQEAPLDRARAAPRAPPPSAAETCTAVGWRNDSSRRRSSSSRSTLLRTSSRGRSPAPISASTSSTAASCSTSSSSGADASATCSDQVGLQRLLERRGERLDQLVRQLADEADGVGQQVACGPQISNERVVGSSVWKRRSRTPTSAPVSAFSSVDLPAFV